MSKTAENRNGLLKTLNDELNKTEEDILVINRHDSKRNRIFIPTQVDPVATRNIVDYMHKTLNFEEMESANIIGGGNLFYKLDCRDRKFPLRVTFTKVKGQMRFMASFRQKYPNAQQSDYNFMVDRQIRRALPARPDSKDILYICFSSDLELGMVNMYVDTYTEHMEKITRIRQGTKSMKGIGMISKSNLEPGSTSELLVSHLSNKLFLTPLKEEKARSLTKESNFMDKNKESATRYKEILSQRMIVYREKEVTKYEDSKTRRQDIERFKEKNREFKLKASESKELIKFRKEKIKEEGVATHRLVRNMAATIEICKFFAVLAHSKQLYVESLKNSSKVKNYQINFVRKLKAKMQSWKELLPRQEDRNKANLRLGLCLAGWAVQNKNMHKVTSHTADYLGKYELASKVNNVLQRASDFRRNVRHLQKSWKLKYNTRLAMIGDAGTKHVKTMLALFKHFKNVEADFEIKGILRKLAVQYVKDTTLRFNTAYLAYFKRLDTLNEISRINENLKLQNVKLAKKNQKPLLKLPATPPRPYPRYFRDLDTFMSMLRAWFELESKKFEKRHKKHNESKDLKEENPSPEKESPVKESPVKESPVKESPVKESPVKESLVKESPLKESPEEQ